MANGQHELRISGGCPKNPNAQGQCTSSASDTATNTFTLNYQADITSLDFTPDAQGAGIVRIGYSFPNTDSPSQRAISFFVNGVKQDPLYGYTIPQATGTLEIPFSVRCWETGTYQFKAVGTHCNGTTDVMEKPIAVNTKPTLELSYDPAPNQAVIKYGFPNTSGSGDRHIKVEWVPSAESPGGMIAELNPSDTSDNPWRVTLGACAINGNRLVKVTATACGQTPVTQDLEATKCDASCNTCPDCPADPIRTVNGNMTYTERDPLPGNPALPLHRTYNSLSTTNGVFGKGWSSLFDAWVRSTGGADGRETVAIGTESTDRFVFRRVSGVYVQTWPATTGGLTRLTYDSASGTYTHFDLGGFRRVFRASDGRLVKLQPFADGHVIDVTYDAAGLPTRLSDGIGNWAWIITTDGANRRITNITVENRPDLSWTYSHDGAGNLQSVSLTSGPGWRTYAYSSAGMTSVRDGSNNLIEGHSYDSQARANSNTGPSGDLTNVEYGLAGRVAGEILTRTTAASGAQTNYYSRSIAGKMRTVEVSGPCSSCGADDTIYGYDVQGRLIREQGAGGYITLRTYDSLGRLASESRAYKPSGCDPSTDPNHCRLNSDTILTTTPEPTTASRTSTYGYADANWPWKVTSITTDSVLQSGGFRIETFGYHQVTGTVLLHTESGYSGDPAIQQSRTTTTTLYNGTEPAAFAPGGAFSGSWLSLPQPVNVPRSTDGPRIDDVTYSVYYPNDVSVPSTWRSRLAARRDPMGNISRWENYDVFGNAGRVVDPNGVSTEFTFDSLGRVLTRTLKAVPGCDVSLDDLCATDITHSYSFSGVTGPLSVLTNPSASVETYTYDSRGRMLTVSRGPSVTDLRERIEYEYDSTSGQKSRERLQAYQGGAWVETKITAYEYDNESRLKRTFPAPLQNPLLNGDYEEFAYDVNDNIASAKDARHAAPNTLYSYDPAERLTKVRQLSNLATNVWIETLHSYDAHDNLKTVTDPNGNLTTYSYDDFGQLRSQSSPITSLTTYSYDSSGSLIATTDANGATTTRSYDASNRILASTSTRDGTSESVTWTYDSAASGFNGKGRVATMTDPTGSTTYRYDRRGLLKNEARLIQGNAYTQGYGYDANGNRSAITYPSGRMVVYVFDYAGRSLSASSSGTTYVSSASYSPFGPETQLVLGNGTTNDRVYDPRYRIVENKLIAPGGTIAFYSYMHDPVGNITQVTDTTNATYNRTFAYDDLNRLVTANSGSSLWNTGGYQYDAMGNLLTLSLGSQNAAFAYSGTTPKLATVTEGGIPRNVSYDPAGNETAVGTNAYYYSPRNNLRQGDNLHYAYDGRGLRVFVSEGTPCFPVASATPSLVGHSYLTQTASLTVSAPTGCRWSATTPTSWITLLSSSGTGNGSISYRINTNPLNTGRSGSILLGNQSVTVSQTQSPVGTDFTADARADMIWRHEATSGVRIQPSNGTSLGSPITVTTLPGRDWKLVGSGDFEGNGDLDLVSRNSRTGEVSVSILNGAVLESTVAAFTEADLYWKIGGVGDFDGNGKSDLMMRSDATGEVRVRFAESLGVSSTVHTVPDLFWEIAAIADFNGDAKSDLAWRHRSTGEISVWQMNGATQSSWGVALVEPNMYWQVVGSGDFNGDLKADLLLWNASTGALDAVLLNGYSVISRVTVTTVANNYWRIVDVGDFDGDADSDLFWRNSRTGQVSTYLMNGTTVDSQVVIYTEPETYWKILGPVLAAGSQAPPAIDFHADSTSDLTWRGSPAGEVSIWRMSWHPTNGASFTNQPVSIVADSQWKIRRFGDNDSDTKTDIIWHNEAVGQMSVWKMNGEAISDWYTFNVATGRSIQAVGDFNADSKADLVWRDAATGDLSMWEMNGAAAPLVSSIATVLPEWKVQGAGDFNGDGKTDLIWFNTTTREVSMWEMDGHTVLRWGVIGTVAPDWRIHGVGDFDGDSKSDLIWRNLVSGGVAMWTLDGQTVLYGESFTTVADLNWKIQQVADYSGDLRSDLIWRHLGSGDVSIWEMNGNQIVLGSVFANASLTQTIQGMEPNAEGVGASSKPSIAPMALGPLPLPASASWWTPAVVQPAVPWWLPPVPPVESWWEVVPKDLAPQFWLPIISSLPPWWGPPVNPGQFWTPIAVAPPIGTASSSTTAGRGGGGVSAHPRFLRRIGEWLRRGARRSAEPVGLSLIMEPLDQIETQSGGLNDRRRYSFYLPELSLLAETEYSDQTRPPVAYEYIWFNGRPVAQIDLATNTTSWTLTDHLGTPLLQTSAAGAVSWRAEYEPYGKVFSLRSQDRHQPLRFPGQEAEQLDLGANGITERSYNIARWYRSGWGRYTQSDPLDLLSPVVGAPPQNDPVLGGYAYGRNNPLIMNDPLGLSPCKGSCPQCPGGKWFYVDENYGYGVIAANVHGSVTYFCLDSDIRCFYRYKCRTVGLQAGAWAGGATGVVGGRDCTCGEALKESSASGSVLFIQFQDHSPCRGLGLTANSPGSAISFTQSCTISQFECKKAPIFF